jgi:DNA-binding transcriptional MocR family regulator
MPELAELPRPELARLAERLERRFEEFRARRLSLDMTRGKPCAEQLDLSIGLLDCLGRDYRAEDGTDCRNYGLLEGLPEARRLFAEYLGVSPEEIIVAGNSSLALMHDAIVQALLRGVPGGAGPWLRQGPVRFLCPCPGYDRHFAICERYGIEMIPVPMTDRGPAIEEVEELARTDPSIRAIWCVPRYSNPTGITYAEDVVERLAEMPTAASDFRILWDNAYAVHHLTDRPEPLKNVLAACKAAGNPDRVWIFGSTSKVSFAGAGVAMFGSSRTNVSWFLEGLSKQTIGPDKLNQLRHVRFFKDLAGIEAHMKKHAAILRPKFEIVAEVFERELAGTGVARWSRPKGGYFVSLDTLDGCAREVVAMAAQAGVKLTPAGATFPYGRDPRDRNIRIAPTVPSTAEIREAMEIVAIAVLRVSVAKILGRRSS